MFGCVQPFRPITGRGWAAAFPGAGGSSGVRGTGSLLFATLRLASVQPAAFE
jgi:hypothetical protein